MLESCAQPENALVPIWVRVSGSLTLSRDSQLRNEELPMLISPAPRSIFVRYVQFEKALLPMDVKLLGRYTEVSVALRKNARGAIAVTPFGTVKELSFLPRG